MPSYLSSLLPSAVHTWFHPKPLIEAINGCLRSVSACFGGMSNISSTEYLPFGRGSEGSVAIPIDYIKDNAKHYACRSITASDSVIAGKTNETSNKWRVLGLPQNIVVLGKSPDDPECLLVGVDFQETSEGYIFSTNPMTAGTVSTFGDIPKISFYYFGGAPKVRDFPQFIGTRYSVTTKTADELVTAVKTSATAVNGSGGLINSAMSGRFCCISPGNLDAVWSEGGVTVGCVGEQLIYANNDDDVKNVGQFLNIGDTLSDLTETKNALVIKNNRAEWWDAVCSTDYSDVVVYSDKIIRGINTDTGLAYFLADYCVNSANNVVVQQLDIDFSGVLSLSGDDMTMVRKAFLLHKPVNTTEFHSDIYSGITATALKAQAAKVGGCVESTFMRLADSRGDYPVLNVVFMSGNEYGLRITQGSVIYAIALADVDDNVYKVGILPKGIDLKAAAVPVVNIKLTGSFGLVTERTPVTDDLSKYWLEVEQEVTLGDTELGAIAQVL